MSLSIGELVGYVTLDTDGVTKGVAKTDSALGKTRSGFSSLAKFAAGAFAAVGAVKFFGDSFGEAEEAMKVSRQTAAVIKSTGGAAKITAGQVADLAGKISAKTGIDDEAIQTGQNMLLTFKNLRNEQGKGNDMFNQATQAMVDMSAAMGTDAKGAAVMLGKALNDPTKGLAAMSRVGITFTAQQEKQIKKLQESGKTMAAQKIILKELKSEFGGSAAAIATPADKAKVAWGNLKEQVGTALMPVISRLATFATAKLIPAISRMVDRVGKLGPVFRQVAGAIRGVLPQLGPPFQQASEAVKALLPLIGSALSGAISGLGKIVPQLATAMLKVVTAAAQSVKWLTEHKTTAMVLAGAIAALVVVTQAHAAVMAVAAAGGMVKWLQGTKLITSVTKVWTAVQWAMNAALTANPIGIVVVAIAALVAGLIIAYKKSDTFRKIVNDAFAAVAKAAKKVFAWLSKAVSSTIDWIKSHWKMLASILGGPFVAAVIVVVSNWSRIKAAVGRGVDNVKSTLSRLAAIPGMIGGWLGRARDAAAAKLGAMVSVAKSIPGKIMGALGNLGHLLWNAGSAVIQGLIDGIQSKINSLTSKLHYITDLIPKHKGPESKDRKLLKPAGVHIMEGLIKGLESMEGKLRDKLKAITDKVASTRDAMSSLAGSIADKFKSDVFGGDLAAFDTGLATDTSNATAFSKAMKQAMKKGLSGGLMRALGESGNVALAQQFAGLSAKDIASRERAFGARASASMGVGRMIGAEVFGDQLHQQTRELRGVRKDLQQTLKKLEKRRHELHVHQRHAESAENLSERLHHKLRTRG